MISLRLPQGSSARGELYDQIDPSWLTQDILEVHLGNGFVIDVGWYPEHDLSGKFWIRVFQDDWNNQKIEPIHTTSPQRVKFIVEELAKAHSNRISSEIRFG